jgi:hypothetical protein
MEKELITALQAEKLYLTNFIKRELCIPMSDNSSVTITCNNDYFINILTFLHYKLPKEIPRIMHEYVIKSQRPMYIIDKDYFQYNNLNFNLNVRDEFRKTNCQFDKYQELVITGPFDKISEFIIEANEFLIRLAIRK